MDDGESTPAGAEVYFSPELLQMLPWLPTRLAALNELVNIMPDPSELTTHLLFQWAEEVEAQEQGQGKEIFIGALFRMMAIEAATNKKE